MLLRQTRDDTELFINLYSKNWNTYEVEELYYTGPVFNYSNIVPKCIINF